MARFADQILLVLAQRRPDADFAWGPGSAPSRPCPIHGEPGPGTGDLLLDRARWTITEVQRMVDAPAEAVRSALRTLVAEGLVERGGPGPAGCECPGPEHVEGTPRERHSGRTARGHYRLTPAGCAVVLARPASPDPGPV